MRQAAQWLDAALLVDAVQPSTNKDRTETTS
jgi:hypothetical protein